MTGPDGTIAGTRRIIPRPALRDAVLSSARQHNLTLVMAPAGSGKTTLLNQIRDQLHGETRNLPAVTVVDDFGGGPGVDRAELAAEIEARLEEGQHYILASDQRLDGLFSTSRVRGAVMEFALEDLALRDAEIDEFLGKDLAEGVSGHSRRVLLERTEGWIGAWNILRMLLLKGTTPVDLAHSFSGRDRDLVAYFDHLVMPAFTSDQIEFLYDIAPLDVLSEPYMCAAAGRAHCADIIRAAVGQCGFVLDHDRNGETQRLFGLFRDYLIGRAKLADPGRYAAAVRRAGDYAATQGNWLIAARLFADAGETDRTFEILRQYSDDLIVGRGEIRGFRRLLGSLPQQYSQTPALAAEHALGSLLTGDYGGAAVTLSRANTDDRQVGGEDERARLQAIGICVAFGLEQFQQVQSEAPRWLELWGESKSRYCTMVASSLFWSCSARLDSAGAFNALSVSRKAVARSRSVFLDGWCTIMAAIHMFEHGQAAAAAGLLEESVETGMIRHTVNLIRAGVAFEQGQVAQTRRLLQLSLTLGTRHTIVDTSMYGWEAAMRLALHDEGLASALHKVDEIEAVAASRHGERARRLIRLRRATLILQESGDGAHPELLSELEEMLNDPITAGYCASFFEELRLTLARCYALSGDARRAILLLQPIQAASQRAHRIGRWGVASLIYAGALARLGELNRSVRCAWPALTQLVEAGYLASATSEQVLLAPLLGALEKRVDEKPNRWAAMQAVVSRLSERAGRPQSASTAEPAEEPLAFVSLTETERHVLALAAQGRSNAEIAASLLIRVTTVKWHMNNVFAKLSVRSRTAAIARARVQGIAI